MSIEKELEEYKLINNIKFFINKTETILNSAKNNSGIFTYDEVFKHLLEGQKYFYNKY